LSIRVFDSIHATLTSIAKKTPKKGYKPTIVLSQISRIDWIIKQCKTLVLRANCLVGTRDTCMSKDKVKLCDTQCANIMLAESPDYTSIWKISENPIVVRVLSDSLEVASKQYKIQVHGSKLSLHIPKPTGELVEKILDISDIDSFYESIDYIKDVLGRFEGELNNMIKNLSQCAKAHAKTCP